MKLRQSPRLKTFDYIGPYAYNLTFVTRERKVQFQSDEIVETCLESLLQASAKCHLTILAYCFMPDHLHLLAASESETPLTEFARLFKQLSGYRFKRTHGSHLWQISYYDRVVRREVGVESIAAYVWGNPVRAGLVNDALDYPYSGPRHLMGEA
jgi:REP-associated tyrosine transposase